MAKRGGYHRNHISGEDGCRRSCRPSDRSRLQLLPVLLLAGEFHARNEIAEAQPPQVRGLQLHIRESTRQSLDHVFSTTTRGMPATKKVAEAKE